ncbi:MAG: hypothetical protein Q4C53_09580 [Clostridia bacterium]|nr:hypothetical protein [Clostridia bacterium]
MPGYDRRCMETVEARVDAIREQALAALKEEFPDLGYVVDPHPLADYFAGQVDKPGAVYAQFVLPGGKTEAELVAEIAENTRRYLAEHRR